MPVTDVRHDLDTRTLTIVADFGAPVERIWEPNGFTFDDGFADLDFNPNPDLPVSRNVFTFTARDTGTRATFLSTYPTVEALQQVLDMGVVEGASAAINQIDTLLSSAPRG